ncbi:MAG: molybdopterin-binding protein [Desulfohalobiaceae bacterium]|nr:molybdopterin-binding protein [Desulfohalobiaceae bacterium]
MKTVPTEQAAGMILGHDITRIVAGDFKGPAFRKGHVVQKEDIPMLLDLGKEQLYVLELEQGILHENEAAERIAAAALGKGLSLTEPVEGKVNLKAAYQGLLKVDVQGLARINSRENIMFATLHSDQEVQKDQNCAGTRIIPLVIAEDKIREVEDICGRHFPVVEIRPFKACNVGLVTTGSEVYHGRIEDRFSPIVQAKFESLGSRIMRQVTVSDDQELTAKAIVDLINEGADFIAVTGGMSVDPDDRTPAAIRATGARVITYGAPILPGAMFMLAYLGGVPIVGLPGCVMYFRASVFDLIVPRLLAGESVSREEIASMGHGGLCAGCPDCRYPVCPFGK